MIVIQSIYSTICNTTVWLIELPSEAACFVVAEENKNWLDYLVYYNPLIFLLLFLLLGEAKHRIRGVHISSIQMPNRTNIIQYNTFSYQVT